MVRKFSVPAREGKRDATDIARLRRQGAAWFNNARFRVTLGIPARTLIGPALERVYASPWLPCRGFSSARTAFTPIRKDHSLRFSLPSFEAGPEALRDIVVNYVCRDRADHLWQFGVIRRPACRPRRKAARWRVFADTGKPGRRMCRLCKACELEG